MKAKKIKQRENDERFREVKEISKFKKMKERKKMGFKKRKR